MSLDERKAEIKRLINEVIHDLTQYKDLYESVIAEDPDCIDARNMRGVALLRSGNGSEARKDFEHILTLDPDNQTALVNLGVILQTLGMSAEAIECFERVLKQNPGHIIAHQNVIFSSDYLPSCDDRQAYLIRKHFDDQHTRLLPRCDFSKYRYAGYDKDPHRRLKIGYVSADFINHSAAFLFGSFMCEHDGREVELFLYHNNYLEDSYTQVFKDGVGSNNFRNVYNLNDEQLCETIMRDQIDILVDLSAHSMGNRMLVFGRKPAPIQATAWGYGTGTGLTAIDYFITSRHSVPEDKRQFFSEKIVYLPTTMIFSQPVDMPEPNALPFLTNGYFTFGSLNRLTKVNDEVAYTWAAILHAVRNSRLLLKCVSLDQPEQRQRIIDRFARYGINEDELILLGKTSRANHIMTYQNVDLGLDPWPTGGGATMSEALWMGVPSISMRGKHIGSRFGQSCYELLDIDGAFLVNDIQEYILTAIAATKQSLFLNTLRRDLRTRIKESPMYNYKQYARWVEQAYRAMWQRYCAGLSPIHMEVK